MQMETTLTYISHLSHWWELRSMMTHSLDEAVWEEILSFTARGKQIGKPSQKENQKYLTKLLKHLPFSKVILFL